MSTAPGLPRAGVIMAGGVGERLWPLSRRSAPKQVLPLDEGGRSLLETSHGRLARLVGAENVFLATTEALAPVLGKHLPQVPAANVLVEPLGRNTAGCLALATAALEQRLGPCVMAIVTADHRIGAPDRFQATFERGLDLAVQRDELIVFGIRPTGPETGFGYVEMGEVVDAHAEFPCHRVVRFTEKPDLETARRHVSGGRHLWNSGMFAWKSGALREAFAEHSPPHADFMRRADALDLTGAAFPPALTVVFENLPNISIDFAVMERAANVAAVPVDFPWIDLGGWEALRAVLPTDGQGNATRGETLLLDSRGCTVHSSGPLIAGCGLEGLAIVATPDAILVCPRERLQEIKEIVGALREDPAKERLT